MNPISTRPVTTRVAAVTLTLVLHCTGATARPGVVTPESVAIEDADTLLVEVAGTRYRIQLSGIDAPESTNNPKLQRDTVRTGLEATALLALGRAADAGLAALLPAFRPYRLRFDPDARDRYGRTPGDLLDGQGRALSARLVEAGYAVPVATSNEAAPGLAAALAAARAAGRGLWGSHPEAAIAWATAVAPASR